MNHSRSTALLALLLLSACSSTVTLVGQMQKSNEPVSGTIVGAGSRGGPGELTLKLAPNVICKGKFVYTSRRKGEGVLNCDDGRSGPFHISSIGTSGTGAGELSGQRFTFTFASEE